MKQMTGPTLSVQLFHKQVRWFGKVRQCALQVRHSVPASIGPPATLQAGISMAAFSQHLVVASIARVAVFDVSVPAAGPVQLFADTLHIMMAALRMQASLPRLIGSHDIMVQDE
jgi:hypothetical protein